MKMKLNLKNKLLIGAVCALFTFVSPVASVEWGGILKNDTQGLLPAFKNFSLSQSDSLYMWLSSPLGESGLYFSGEGMYKFTLTTADSNFTQFIDVDLLKISGDYETAKGILSVSAGRYMVSDNTAAIFAQNIDGVSVKYAGKRFSVSGFGGYTGLLNSLNVTMLNKDGVSFSPETKIYSLSNGFVPAGVSFELPSLFANQSLSIQTLAFIDLGEEKYNRFYGTLLLSGPITNSFLYNFSTSFGTNDFSSLMNYSALNFYLYPKDFLSVSFGAEYASGKNGSLSPFLGVTSRSVVNSLTAPQTTGAIVPNVVFSVVLDRMYFGVTSKFLMAIPEGKVETKGVEADLSFIYAVFTDLQIGFDLNSYFDISKNNEDNLTATLRAAISF